MATKKVLITKGVTPPGFFSTRSVTNENGVKEIVVTLDPLKPGDVVELENDPVPPFTVGLADRYIAAGIAVAVSASERVTAKANNGAYVNGESGPEKPNSVPTETKP